MNLPSTARRTSKLPINALSDHFAHVRGTSLQLVAPLSDEDCQVQSMPDASPAKWHLAHTTWFFETFVLEAFEPDFAPFNPNFRVLFNSYYQGVGEQHPRAQRGLVTRPSLAEVKRYRESVNTRVMALLQGRADHEAIHALVTLGLHHEQQHQELLLTDIKHLCPSTRCTPATSAGGRVPSWPGKPCAGWASREV